MKTFKTFIIALITLLFTLPAFCMDLNGNTPDAPKKNKNRTLIQVFDGQGNITYSQKVNKINKRTVSKLPKNSHYLFTHNNTAYFMISNSPDISIND